MPETYLVRPGYGMPHSAARYFAGCRCLICTAAHQSEQLAESRRQPARPRTTAAHGSVERAAGGCRCVTCTNRRREVAT